jgi:hypothetical protein
MTFSEFLRKEYEYIHYIPPGRLIELAIRWHEEEVKRIVPSEENLADVLYKNWDEYVYDKNRDVWRHLATTLRKFLEERIK